MISILWVDLPDTVVNTQQYQYCNTSYEKGNVEFEKYFRCKLRHLPHGWAVQFGDEDYTWFLMRWS